MKQISIKKGYEKYLVELLATVMDDSIVVILGGGERPHVGSVVLSVPRSSLRCKSETSCNTFVLPIVGHKDDEIAKPIAERICRATRLVTTVTVGLHVEAANKRDIELLAANANSAVCALLTALSESREP